MAISALTNDQITDILGNIELHILTIKFQWQAYLNAPDTATQSAAMQEAVNAIMIVQQILNTIETPLAVTLPTIPLTAAQMTTFGITPAVIPVPAPVPQPIFKKERTKWQKQHGLD
ncbi:MAG: hypothetical protein WA799_08925 [Nitrosotalea sp.]